MLSLTVWSEVVCSLDLGTVQVLLYTRFWDQEKQQMLNQLTFKDPDSNVKDNTCTQTGQGLHRLQWTQFQDF